MHVYVPSEKKLARKGLKVWARVWRKTHRVSCSNFPHHKLFFGLCMVFWGLERYVSNKISQLKGKCLLHHACILKQLVWRIFSMLIVFKSNVTKLSLMEREWCSHEFWCEMLILVRSRMIWTVCPCPTQTMHEQAKDMSPEFHPKTRTSVNSIAHAHAVWASTHPERASVQCS